MILALFTICAACGESPVAPPPPTGCTVNDQPVFELGTGVEVFEDLAAEQDLQMVAGPQGGCHFWVAGRTNGFAERRFNVRYDVRFADTGTTTGSRSSLRITLVKDDARPGQCGFSGFQAVLIQPWRFEDRRVVLDVTVTDDLGRSATDSATVVARWPEATPGIPRDDLCGPR